MVVFDPKGDDLGDEADRVRLSRPTVGASGFAGQLEKDRMLGMDVARSVGIEVAEVQSFKGALAFARAKQFLLAKPREVCWVFKICGKAPENVGTYVSKEGRGEMLRLLGYFEDQYVREGISPNFLLTVKVDGVEVSTEAWFNGMDFFLPNHTIERTKLAAGDLGEKTGCQGNVVWSTPQSPLYHKLLEPLRPLLIQGGFASGPLDINVIISKAKNEPMFLEFSPRFGYDAIFSFMELFNQDFGEFLYSMATGQSWGKPLIEAFAGDVRIQIPPFPAKGSKDSDDEAKNVPVFGYDARKFDRHICPIELMLDRDNKTVTSGPHGIPLSVTDVGNTPREAMENVYKRIEGIHIPNMRYRNDLAEAIGDIFDGLSQTGWLADRRLAQPKTISWPRGHGLGLWSGNKSR